MLPLHNTHPSFEKGSNADIVYNLIIISNNSLLTSIFSYLLKKIENRSVCSVLSFQHLFAIHILKRYVFRMLLKTTLYKASVLYTVNVARRFRAITA
jgi:hypothetical protein